MKLRRPSGRQFLKYFLGLALVYIIITGIVVHLTKNSNINEIAENAAWVASSKNWLDRQACRWIGVCGLQHYIC